MSGYAPTSEAYVADEGNSVVRMVSFTSGIISTVAGNGSAGYVSDGVSATSTPLGNPVEVAVDGAGNLYIADTGNNRIREVNATTGIITTVVGTGVGGFAGMEARPKMQRSMLQVTSTLIWQATSTLPTLTTIASVLLAAWERRRHRR